MAEEKNKQTAIIPQQVTEIIPGEWAIKKLLGPTLDEMGTDLQLLYKIGKDKIIVAALRKLLSPEDNYEANLRVTRDVFWNGSFTDESICAEYFGGILASSRSIDGKDDRGIYYADIIKSLSSQQLLFHYTIYFAFNKLLLNMSAEKERPNAGFGTDLQQYEIWFATQELDVLGISAEKDLIALGNKDLIHSSYEENEFKLENGQNIRYTKVKPSTLGIQLYAVAHNKLPRWRLFPYEDFGSFPDIQIPTHFTFTQDELFTELKLK